MHTIKEKTEAFEQILEIMDRIRSECPWDKAQTNESLRQLTIEETYELAEAIISNKPEAVKEELGDLKEKLHEHELTIAKGHFSKKEVLEVIDKTVQPINNSVERIENSVNKIVNKMIDGG